MTLPHYFSKRLRSDFFSDFAERPTTLHLIVGVFMPVSTLLFIITLSKNVPYYDQWEFISLLDKFYTGNLTFVELLSQHNEHRFLFPRLCMIALAYLTHWNIRAEITFSVLMAIAIFLLLCQATNYSIICRKEKTGRPYVIYSLLSILIFSMLQGDNWLWGWQLGIFINVLSMVLGFYTLVFAYKSRWFSLFIAIVCGIVASFSFANGLLYWIIGTGALSMGYYKDKWSAASLLTWLFASIIVIVSYLYDFKTVSGHTPLSYSLLHPLAFVSYMAVFLGSAICQIPRFVSVSLLIGISGFGLLVYLIRKLIQAGELTDWPLMFWHCLLAYSLLSDLLAALGRSSFGLDQALSSRYVTIGNFFWIWLVVMTFRVGQSRMNAFFPKILPLAATICAGIILLSMVQVVRVYSLRKRLLERNETALRRNQYDINTLRSIVNTNPSIVPPGNRTMQRNKLSFYWR